MKIICPNCGYQGNAKVCGGVSCVLLLILLCLGVIPGIIYALVAQRKNYRCPNCGNQI